jgi:hypothetical protein
MKKLKRIFWKIGLYIRGTGYSVIEFGYGKYGRKGRAVTPTHRLLAWVGCKAQS